MRSHPKECFKIPADPNYKLSFVIKGIKKLKIIPLQKIAGLFLFQWYSRVDDNRFLGGGELMKKTIMVMVFGIIVLLSGCSSDERMKDGTTFYVGKGESWLATYSISKIEETYYESFTIQYLFGNEGIMEVGPIGFELVTSNGTWESSDLQVLQGVGSFHTSSISNADMIQLELDQELDLTIRWEDRTESMKLERIVSN